MNAQCYRVIFNKARGMLMVVSESARSQGKTSNPTEGGSAISQVAGTSQTAGQSDGKDGYQGGRLISLRAHLLLALGLATIVGSSAYADTTNIVADRNAAAAQQATILKSSNGTTQVNIQTPSAAGVSRNVFSQFDVGADGAILNNSRKNAQTQLAGWVEGNPYLARGEARVILNEVNSSDPSRLSGYTEIAGGRAELVIANPAGITCAGCGFINASRTTLTTGQALMDQGKLTSFDVKGGNIRIEGDGLDTSGSDYTQIIAKTAEINAGVYAKNLDVITGSNQVSYEEDAADTVITSKNAQNNTNQTTGVALDVSALGAMYAGKIRLIGTDKGMGVTNAGSIVASAGGLQLDHNGNLINSGSLVANKGNVDIANKGFNVDNSGTIASSRNAINVTSNDLTNSGVISSRDTLTLQQAGGINNSGEISTGSFNVKAASLNNSGSLLQTGSGNLAIDTSQLTNKQSAIIGQDLYADASTPPSMPPSKTPPTTANNGSSVGTGADNQPSEPNPVPLPNITRNGNIRANNLTNTGSIYSNGKINVAADSVVNQDKASLAVSRLDIANNGSASNTDSRLQLDQINWQLANFDNDKGQIITSGGITLDVDNGINNTQGVLASSGDITLKTKGRINNSQGQIQSNANLSTDSSSLNNNNGKLISQGAVTINSRGDLTNTKGVISSTKDAIITSKIINNNSGQITAQGSLTIGSDSLNNSGQLYGKSQAQITTTDAINNSGIIASGGDTFITTGNLTQADSGSLVAGMDTDGKLAKNRANLSVKASGDITSQGNHIATGDVLLTGGNIDLASSNIQGSRIKTAARTGLNTKNATVTATDRLTLSSTDGILDNTAGNLRGGVLEIDAKRLNNTDGSLIQTGKQDLTLAMVDGIDNTRGEIASNSDNLTIDTSLLNNSSGKIIHASQSATDDSGLSIDADSVNNTNGEVLSVGSQTWQIAKDINNTAGVIQANRFAIHAQNIDNTDGRIVATQTTTDANKESANNAMPTSSQLKARENLINLGKGIIASNTGSLAIAAERIDNSKGQISSLNDLSVRSNTLNNSGSLYSQGNTDVSNQGQINNSGSITAQGNTTVKTGTLAQSATGQLIAGLTPEGKLSDTPSHVTVNSTGQQVNAGTNIATGNIKMQGSELDLSNGNSQGTSIDMQADAALINNKGIINGDNITLQASQISNNVGLIIAADALALNTELLSNQAGEIRHLGASPLSLAIADINNQNGYIGSNAQTLTINSERLNNNKGVIQHSGSDSLNIEVTENLQGQEGQLITGNTLTLSGQDIDLSGASTQAGAIKLTVSTLSNQDGEIILTDKAHDSLIDVQQQLNNINGRIASQNKQLLIDAGSIDNTTGDIVSENDLKVNANQLINEKGLLASKADVLLNISGQLNNQSGLVSSEKNLTILADSLNNDETLGQGDLGILADNIALNVNTLSNQAGLIEAKERVNISADTSVDNSNGLVASGGALAITDSNIDNRQLDIINKDGSLVANTTNGITARSLSGDGSILSFQDISVDLTSGFNQSKTMSANGNIVFKTQGNFTNQGIIEAGNSLNITTNKNLENFNKIKSNQEISLTADNITNHSNAQVIANNNKVQAKGKLTNNGSLEGSSSLTIDTSSLDNSGNIIAEANSGKLTVNVGNTLQNTGLINAGKVTIKADELLNSEKIFGGNIAIQANRLVNGKDKTAALSNVGGSNKTGGAIASRGNLALAGNTILNEEGALIYAQGDLSVGGSLDAAGNTTGSATSLTNASADIRVAGNASLNAKDINNENRHLTTTTKVTQDPNTKVVFSESLDSKEYAADEIRLWRTWNDNDPKATQYNDNTSEFFEWFGGIDGTKTLEAQWGIELPDGKQITEHVSKRFKETMSETAVSSSDPGSISIGGNLIFSDNLTNIDSEIIVGGSVSSPNGNSVQNISTEGERVLERNGIQLQYRIERDNNGVKSSRWESRQNEGSYSDSIKTTFDLDTTTFIKNSNVDVAQQDIEKTEVENSATESVQDNGIKQRNIVNDLGSNDVTNVTDNTQTSSPKEIKNTDNVAVDINKATLEGSSARNQAINEQKQDSITVQNSNPRLPTNSLFGINPDSQASYLVEVDPAFNNYKKWLSSDYMLDRLQLDPTVTQKRLGDGFYEQALIRDQIHQLTGNYFLDNNQDDQTQYQMLMDNGLTFAQDYNLRPGIALSAAQVAQLTSDIVWLIEETVTLGDGKSVTALIPKVYLRPEGLQLRPNGSLISAGEGFNLNLSGDFKNVSGVVMGRDVMNISANNIDNISGLLTSDTVNLNAVEDINNIGGEVRANSVLFANAGNDINIESTTQNSNNGKRINLDRIAGFYVDDKLKGQLQATAGRNINIAAANIDNAAEQGNTVLYAGKNINLGTVKTGFSESLYVDEDNQRTVKVSNEVGSKVTGKGNISLRADDDINVKGSSVKSNQGAVNVSAGQNINVENGISSEAIDARFKYQVSGQIAREKVKNVDTRSKQTTSESLFEGNNVNIDSQNGNVSLIGTNVKALEEARVTAMNGEVTIQSAVDKDNLSYNKSTTSFYKETGHQQGYERETLSESGINGASVYLNGKNVDVNAANLQARDGNLQVGNASLATDTQGNLKLDENGKPIVQAGSIDNLTFGTIELEDSEWNNRQKSYKGIAKVGMQVAGVVGGALGVTDGITISKSSEDTSSNTREAVSNLEGKNILVGGKTVKADGTTFKTTQAGGSTFVLGNDIDLGVATTTSTSTQKRQEETIGGEGIKLGSDSLQLGAVVRTDSEDTKTTTTATHQGVTIDSDHITVLGDMTDGSLTTKTAKFNASEKTGSLLIGAKTTNLGGIENTETVTNKNKTDTTRLSVDVHHASVDVISAAEQVKKAGSAVAAAKNELSDAKDRVSRGELSADAVKDYEINLAAATLNLANAQINLGSTAAGAANTAATAGFSATAKAEHTRTTSTDTQSKGEWQGTELNGANATFVGDDFKGTGLKGNIGKLNIDNLNSLNLRAGTNTSSGSSTSKTSSQTGSISTTGSASLGISQQQSSAQSQGNTYTNSELNVGEFNGYAGTTNLTGGRINAGGGSYATDTLNIETVQNSASSSDKSSGGNIGINFAGGAPSGGSIGANKANGNSQSLIAAEQSGIVYSSDNQSLTANNTTNIGGILAKINTDKDGKQTNGALNFITGSLTTTDLINTATEEQRSIGGSLSTGKTATGVSLNNVGIQLGNTGRDFESVTRATIGQGATVTGDALTGKDSLAGVNRDALNTETITKDMQTGGLAVDTGIDTRVLTSKGRAEIADEQKKLPENVRQTTENIVKSLPDNNFKQKTLAVLDNMEARLAEVPVAFKEVGGDLLEAYPEYIKQGGEPEDFETMFNNAEVLEEIKEINNLLAEAATYQESYRQQAVLEYMNKDGLTQEQALQEVEKDIASSNYLLNNYAAINDTKDTNVNSNTASEYLSTDGLNSNNDDAGNTSDTSSLQAGNGDYDGDEGPSVILDTIRVIANRVTLLPNASSDTAIIGNDSIVVSNDSSLAIDMLSKSAQIKRKVDKVVAMTGINPDDAMLAVTLALKGPIALVQPVITDALVGEKLEQGIDYVQNTATGWVHHSNVDTVTNLTDGSYVQGNQTTKQLSEQLALTKEGVGIITTVALGSAAGVTYLGTKTNSGTSAPSMGTGQRGAIGDAKEGTYTYNPDGSITGAGKGRATSTGQFDNNGNEIYQRDSGGYYVIDDNGIQRTTSSPNEHGNTLGNQPTEIYQKYDAEGNYLKTGISQNANTRYKDSEMQGGFLDIIGERPRNKAVQIERNITERRPGPDNKESWAGKRDPSHPNYDPDYVPPHMKKDNKSK